MNNLDILYKECQSVAIDYDRLIQFTEKLPIENYDLPNECIFQAHEDQLCWIMITQALSFALWEQGEKQTGTTQTEVLPPISLTLIF